MAEIAILGAGSWGTALAVLWAEREPALWDHDTVRASRLQASRRNERYLPGVVLPDTVRVSGDLEATVEGAAAIVVATPSQSVRGLARALRARASLQRRQTIVNASKGLELETGCRMSEVLLEELSHAAPSVVSLVGPSHAEEVARGLPTTVVVAGPDEEVLRRAQSRLSTETFRVYTNTDVVGVELAVALKNVIAIAAGISDGLGFGDNSRGALLTRGLAEMARLGEALGARPETFAGLAGLGDLVTTATSKHSRNRNLGEAIARGATLPQALADLGQVAEGVHTTRAATVLASQHDVELPITNEIRQILFEEKDPKLALRDLMLRAPKPEVWGASRGDS
jgi:glycerol-3-phosphate dehydrogenase (NAD(P)+)